jgi:hypothetical protein
MVAPIRLDILCRLLVEYTERLNQKTNTLRNSPRSHATTLVSQELSQDVQYLISQTEKLIAKGSAYHEHGSLDEGERFELEIRLFDAEDALRSAKRTLTPQGSFSDIVRATIPKS